MKKNAVNELDKVAKLRREVFRLSTSREKAAARIRVLEHTVTTLTDVMKLSMYDTSSLAEAAESIVKTSKHDWGFVKIAAEDIAETLHRIDNTNLIRLVDFDLCKTIAETLNEVRQEPQNAN